MRKATDFKTLNINKQKAKCNDLRKKKTKCEVYIDMINRMIKETEEQQAKERKENNLDGLRKDL